MRNEHRTAVSTVYWCLSEFVTQGWLSMYYSSRDIQNLTNPLHSRLFPNLRNNLKSVGSPVCECSMNYGTLKVTLVQRDLTATRGLALNLKPISIQILNLSSR